MRSIKLPSWIERALGLEALPVPPHAFFLSARRLAYARSIRSSGGRVEVAEHRSIELPEDLFSPGLLGGPPQDPAVFRQGIARFVGELSEAVPTASLVLPDAWLRLSFTEGEALPASPEERSEVLRFKLKRLVPFRVDELRIDAAEVAPLAGQQEPRRLLLGFAVEPLLAAIESAFSAAGVALGVITNASLALTAALPPTAALGGLVLIAEEGYSLVFSRGSEPVLHRFKAASSALSGAARSTMVRRDLRLTRTFLAQQLPGVPLERVLLAAPPASEAAWLDLLAEGLGCAVEPLAASHLPPLTGLPDLPWTQTAPLVGATLQEVA